MIPLRNRLGKCAAWVWPEVAWLPWAHRSAAWNVKSQQTGVPEPAPAPDAELGCSVSWWGTPAGSAECLLQETEETPSLMLMKERRTVHIILGYAFHILMKNRHRNRGSGRGTQLCVWQRDVRSVWPFDVSPEPLLQRRRCHWLLLICD